MQMRMLLDHLQLQLDKLNLATKIPHKHKGQPNHAQGFRSWISHGTGNSNLAAERKLIKEMARSQHRVMNDLDLSSSTLPEQFEQFTSCLSWGDIDKSRYTQMLEKLKQIEEKKEKTLADSANKSNIFNSLTLRNSIEEQIKVVKKMSLELRVEQHEVQSAIEDLSKELDPRKENEFVYDYKTQLWEMLKQKEAAQRCILKLRQTFDEMNGMYDENVAVLSNARELARNKDIAALRQLSHHQVEEFMSEWNHPYVKSFRANYEFNILDSLRNRGLSGDGRIKFRDDDQETLRLLTCKEEPCKNPVHCTCGNAVQEAATCACNDCILPGPESYNRRNDELKPRVPYKQENCREIMAMDDSEANSTLQIPILGGEEYGNSSAFDQILDLEVHQFYFVKFWPYRDPYEASKIGEAEQLIQDLDQKLIQMRQQYKLTTLDKLNLATKIPHKHKGQPNHAQGFRSWISHGTGNSNLAAERKLIKEMARSQHKVMNDLDLSSSTFPEQFEQFTSCLSWGDIDKSRYTQMLEKLKQIEEKKEKTLADSANKSNIFNSLTLRNSIEEQIKVVKKMSLELRVEQHEVRSAIEDLSKELDPRKENEFVYDYKTQLWEMLKQKEAAQHCILKLRQTFDEMNGMYDENVAVLSNARELARNKDIAALRQLSHHQVEEFMSEWNHPYVKSFRANYEFNILDSLRNRGLSGDGRIKFRDDDQETLRYIEDGSNICCLDCK
ncbi:hypothetical protein GQ457_13G027690 [Hibiscus cannabinus]